MIDKLEELLLYIEKRHIPEKMMWVNKRNKIYVYRSTQPGSELYYTIPEFFRHYKEEIAQHSKYYKTMMAYILGAKDE